MDTTEHLSADELKAELAALNQQRSHLSAALQQRAEQERIDLAAEIKTLISERGHALEEITELVIGRSLNRKRRRSASSANDAQANYTRYADPDNPANTYTRGRMPAWLIDKMAANGFDPADVEHRQQFKTEHLVQLAA
ncbi:H-NS histone family protein [Lamprobacter modestohalophilus]|uniref:H-NS histone family protein n=1 Tax=Lamprobacter modestohalophilus TaxID=1064514 RepID=UPI002ADEBE28|nr:H-NS histone family protein [Lamprobacter modestohalophilus]MEA1052246.1 H-NS histone family protein [Lamprobacter modestohalophilus]